MALAGAPRVDLTGEPAALEDGNVFIVTVTAPIDRRERPDLIALLAESDLRL